MIRYINILFSHLDIVLRYLLQQLQLQILTGGLANYSYKVTCTDDDSTSPLFAKLTFTYALVFPDKKCPLARTQFEYDALMMYHNVLSNSPRSSDTAVTPYFCINVGDDKKLLVTEFSPLDEQGSQWELRHCVLSSLRTGLPYI